MRKLSALVLALTVTMISTVSAMAQCVALTFDDGPHPSLTPKLLSILQRENVKATFYLVGQMVQHSPAVARAIVADGHEVGNHSWNHPNLAALSSGQVRSQIERTDAAILAATGVRPKTLRAPYGALTSRIQAMFSRPFVGWGEHGDTNDWKNRNATIVASRGGSVPSGEIVLMHDIHPTTVAAVPEIIRRLKARGFRFVTVSEYLSGACGRVAHAG